MSVIINTSGGRGVLCFFAQEGGRKEVRQGRANYSSIVILIPLEVPLEHLEVDFENFST